MRAPPFTQEATQVSNSRSPRWGASKAGGPKCLRPGRCPAHSCERGRAPGSPAWEEISIAENKISSWSTNVFLRKVQSPEDYPPAGPVLGRLNSAEGWGCWARGWLGSDAPHLWQEPAHQGACCSLCLRAGHRGWRTHPFQVRVAWSLCSQREALGSPLPGLGCHPEVGGDPQKLLRPSGRGCPESGKVCVGCLRLWVLPPRAPRTAGAPPSRSMLGPGAFRAFREQMRSRPN